jgi:hypothetical protein
MHELRTDRWGAGSEFLAARARTTAELLEQLAAEGFDPCEDPPSKSAARVGS